MNALDHIISLCNTYVTFSTTFILNSTVVIIIIGDNITVLMLSLALGQWTIMKSKSQNSNYICLFSKIFFQKPKKNIASGGK